ncbi:hypothetical protein C488_15237 [Natrinema pellirubrum DSM 15624]|uniref:Uncharacterized protein n=1 Tax=Natrinema pellirubrum (strain DSM 15624 / CIP 106293 / JCM 10476 / NCIMB 786 / 157) TaxID=797303 RepID=L9YEW5_NATP1|nr:hypothetical protein C488_15237 [Natrinema pellirubrum DSM 15624]
MPCRILACSSRLCCYFVDSYKLEWASGLARECVPEVISDIVCGQRGIFLEICQSHFTVLVIQFRTDTMFTAIRGQISGRDFDKDNV